MELGSIQTNKRNLTLLKIDNFSGGTNNLVDEARLNPKYASNNLNMIQVQDGLWKTRWGFNYYGQEIAGEDTLDGASEYIKSDGTRELIAVGGTTGKVWRSTDGGSWEEVLGATYTPDNPAFFLQISGYLYITNGVDDLAYYDGIELNTYTALAEPTNLVLTKGAGLATGNYNNCYQVTAVNDVGETAGSTEQIITTDTERTTWVATDNEYITLDWTAVANANRYNIYYDDESGYETYLGTTTTNTFRDDGSGTPADSIEVPDDNTTTAPKFKTLELSGNKIWGTNDPDNQYRVYASGAGQYLGYFSPFYGGFWVDLELGGRDKPIKVVHYRTGKGDPIATVLCSSPEGLGSIWQIEANSITVGDTTFIVPITYKVVGSIGSNAPKGVVKARDTIFFPNKRGIFALQNKQQMFNVLSTDELSQNIRSSYRSLAGSKINDICGYYYDGKVFFSAAESSTNDAIFIHDLERKNWNYKWDKGVKDFLEYTDSGDNSHLLCIPTNGGRLWEISENFLGDFGGSFYQFYLSPLMPISKDKTDMLKHVESLVELGRPRGTITFEILGIGKNSLVASIGTVSITSFGSNSGVGVDLASNFLASDTSGVPSVYTQSTTKKAIKKRKKIYNLQYKVSSNYGDTDYTILSLQTKGRVLKQRTPSGWLN
jgi:hypothetical protein